MASWKKVITGSVASGDISNSAVTTAKIANDAVTNGKIADEAIDNNKLANGAVTADALASNAVTTAKINGSAVTTAKIATDAVTMAKIADQAVGTDQIAQESIIADHIQDEAIENNHLSEESVVESAIEPGAVTASKIADNAINFNKLSYTGQKATGQALVYNQYVTGNISVQSFISTQSFIFTHNFSDDISNSTHYLPWSGTAEGTSINGSDVGITAPVNMTFRRLLFRSEWISANVTITFKFYRRDSGTSNYTLIDSTTLTFSSTEDHTVKSFEDGVASSQINYAVSKNQQAIIQLVANVDGTQFSDFGVSSIWSVDYNDMDW